MEVRSGELAGSAQPEEEAADDRLRRLGTQFRSDSEDLVIPDVARGKEGSERILYG